VRFLHTMIRVNNPEESLRFYVEFRRRGTNTIIELTYNRETHQYDLGAIGRLALGVKDVYKRAPAVPNKGAKNCSILVR
jgi:lactoylglutathione lyase